MTEPKWHCRKGELVTGPYSEDQLRRMIQSGMVLPTDRVRHEGREDWVEASTLVRDFRGAMMGQRPRWEEWRLARIAWFYCWLNRMAIPYALVWISNSCIDPAFRIHWLWLVFWPPMLFLYARSQNRSEAPIYALLGLAPWIYIPMSGVVSILNLMMLAGLNREARSIFRLAGWEVGIVGEPPCRQETRASTFGAVAMATFLAVTILWALILVLVLSTAPKPPQSTADSGGYERIASAPGRYG